ncbi:hypothetical protein BKA65DRAFT_75843 [Rhexocercosporidium sp. MPI-PUGE-AT-0058]|nr:hypothetical protein BKA65DRAFT_75843 [Rhexocercosporidium sp. MPI-PUGE-AT-0058]
MSLPVHHRWKCKLICVTRQGGSRGQWIVLPSHVAGKHRSYHTTRYQLIHVNQDKISRYGTFHSPYSSRKGFSSTTVANGKPPKKTKAKSTTPSTPAIVISRNAKPKVQPREYVPTKVRLARKEGATEAANLAPPATEIEAAWNEHTILKANHAASIREERSVISLKIKDLGGLAWGNLTTTIPCPRGKLSQVGIKREFGAAKFICTGIKDPEVRKQVVKWEENGCNHLEGSFRNILNLRAKIATLHGFRNFLDFEAAGSITQKKIRHYKMLDAQSAVAFVDELQVQLRPLMDSSMGKLRELSMKDEHYNGP